MKKSASDQSSNTISTQQDVYKTLRLSDNPDLHPQVAMYQSIFAHYPDGIVTLSITGEIVDCNAAVLKHFGYTKQDVSNTHFTAFIPNEHLDDIVEQFMFLLSGEPVQYDTELLHKDGRRINSRLTSTPIHSGSNVIGMYSIIQDTTKIFEAHNEVTRIKNNLTSAQQIAKIGSWELNIETGKVFWSDQVYTIFGMENWQRKSVTLESMYALTHPKDLDRFKKTFCDALKTGNNFEIEFRFINPSGDERIAYLKSDCVFDDYGRLKRMLGIIQDITALRNAETSLQENRAQTKVIYDSLEAAVWSKDLLEEKMIFVSKGVEALTGIKRAAFLEGIVNWRNLIHPEDQEAYDQTQHVLKRGEKVEHQYRIVHESGEPRWVEDQTIPIFNSDGEMIRLDGIVGDITERKRYEEQMEIIASRDPLTGLYNQRHFEKVLTATIKKANTDKECFSVFFIDIDHFKATIDVLGHQTGDNVIKLFSKRLLEFIKNRGYAARMSGDEFILCIFHQPGMEQINRLAAELTDVLEKVMKVDGYDILTTQSIGISTYKEHGDNSEMLIKNADIALYHVKQEGAAAWKIYDPHLTKDINKFYELGRDLRQAIAQNEMHLVFQPKVDAANGYIIGAEALSRWNHPKWGPISPADFIPLAEEHGWIDDLSNWSLANVCKLISNELQAGRNIVPISVNVSPRWLLKSNFVRKVKETIQKHAIAPDLIEFEITETHIIQNSSQVEKVMNELKAFGIRFALDDFGTGFSSVSHLSRFDIDILKIDRALIHNINRSVKNQTIVEGLVYMAKNLVIDVIVEGVETKDELDFLLQQKCSFIQGYIFSRPLLANDFIACLSKMTMEPADTI